MKHLTVLSDLHIGHMGISNIKLIDDIKRETFPYIEKSDILIICGDITDRSMDLSDATSNHLVSLFLDIFNLTDKLNIPIFILRGTISHDRENMSIPLEIHKKYGYRNKIYFKDTLDITYVEELGYHVLSIPDNLNYKNIDDVYLDIKKKMHELDIDDVEYVFFHGTFRHVFPEYIKLKSLIFEEKKFKFVKKNILAGHIHTHSQRGKVIYIGSFERLNHGEEEDKGFLFIEDHKKFNKIKFIKNKNANLFISINVDKLKDAIKEIDKKIKDKIVNLRLISEDSDKLKSLQEHYVNKKNINVKILWKKKDKQQDIKTVETIKFEYENLPEVIKEFCIMNKYKLDLKDIKSILKKVGG